MNGWLSAEQASSQSPSLACDAALQRQQLASSAPPTPPSIQIDLVSSNRLPLAADRPRATGESQANVCLRLVLGDKPKTRCAKRAARSRRSARRAILIAEEKQSIIAISRQSQSQSQSQSRTIPFPDPGRILAVAWLAIIVMMLAFSLVAHCLARAEKLSRQRRRRPPSALFPLWS